MKIKKNGKVIRLTESDLKRIVKRVLSEQTPEIDAVKGVMQNSTKYQYKILMDALKESGDIVVFDDKYFQSNPTGVIENLGKSHPFFGMKINGVANSEAISKFESDPQKYIPVELTDQQIYDLVQIFKFYTKDRDFSDDYFSFDFDIIDDKVRHGRGWGSTSRELSDAGKFNYTYDNGEIIVTPAEGNKNTICKKGKCVFSKVNK